MKTLKQTYEIKAPLEKVWQALVNPTIIEKWSDSSVMMDDKIGTKFSLWSGEIYGTNIKVTPNKSLDQEWFGGKWDKPSIVTFTLSQMNNKTTIQLLQKDVPDTAAKDIAEGWKIYYLGPMKKFLEKR